MKVPVVDIDQRPLMPTSPRNARKLIKSGEATPFWKKGIFCIRLNKRPNGPYLQDIAVGIDPGSKKEGFSVKSEAYTYLNIQADAVDWVNQKAKTRREMRRGRRYRTTPYRKNRKNRARGNLPPSTKARWQWKLRICWWLNKLFPISDFVVEDIKAITKGKRGWDKRFSPLQVGKQWFYKELEKIAPVYTKPGFETKQLRDQHGLKKVGKKMAEVFEAHCVDSWVLANWLVGGHTQPDNKEMLCISPVKLIRRQLHKLQPAKGGKRKREGGTRSLGLKRGSLIKHTKWGVTYVGGNSKGRVSLHCIETGKRLCQNAKPEDWRFLTFNIWKTHFLSH